MVENVYKRGRYTFAFAHYQVSFGNLRGAALHTPLEEVASNEVQPAQAQPSPRLAKSLLEKSNACYTNIVFS